MTAFALAPREVAGSTPSPLVVAEVMVQREWFSQPHGHEACGPDWKDW